MESCCVVLCCVGSLGPSFGTIKQKTCHVHTVKKCNNTTQRNQGDTGLVDSVRRMIYPSPSFDGNDSRDIDRGRGTTTTS